MNITYSCSDLYSQLAGISLTSLLENNKDAENINIYILDNQISEDNKKKLTNLVKHYGRDISFYSMLDLNKYGLNIDVGRWNISTFGRLYEASILPEDVERVIHIDCDTIIVDSLLPLWNLSMEGYEVAGVIECIGHHYKKSVGITGDMHYINAGNIMINLMEIRRCCREFEFTKYIQEHEKLEFVDQAVLNAVIPNDKILVVPLKYNAFSINFYLKYKNVIRAKHVTNYVSEEEYNEAIEHPVVVHFTSCFMDGTRPWIKGNLHPYIEEYLKYKAMSPWASMTLWEDTRGKITKLFNKVFRFLPQIWAAWTVGFLHEYVLSLKKGN